MNKVQKFVTGWAQQINQREHARKVASEQEIKAVEDKAKHRRGLIRNAIEEFLQQHSDVMRRSRLPHMKAGDKLILNKYSLKHRYCSNGWDGGYNTLYREIKPLDAPAVITVTSVAVGFSYAEKITEQFVEHFTEGQLEYVCLHLELVPVLYRKYVADHDRLWKENYGLYWEVFFDTGMKFQPVWGLNAACFLPMDSIEGRATFDLWKREIHQDQRRIEINRLNAEIEKERLGIQRMYERE